MGLVNDRGQRVLLDAGRLGGAGPYEETVEVIEWDEYRRRFLPLAHARVPVKRLRGYDATWAQQHVDHPDLGWDSAIVPHLQRLHVAGFATASSCQGGWYPMDAMQGSGGVYDSGVLWTRKAPHLFLAAGPGHGGGGVLRGVAACQRHGLGTWRAEAGCRPFTALRPRIAADELNLYVILEGHAMSDVQARAWWDRVVALAEG